MTIDIRAKVVSSVGELISGEVSDSYLPDAGLVFTSGSIVLAGLYKLAVGDVIELAYLKKGKAVRIPRHLRVLSSFADPLRRQTSVELGCTLTLYQDRKPMPLTDPLPEPEYSCEESYRVPPYISASFIFANCCRALGIGYSSNPLTNSFLLDGPFDYSSGYVTILGDLLKSEGYFGHMNSAGSLRVINLYGAGGSGPVLNKNKIIDISSTSSSDIPGDAVTVSYSSNQLTPPEPEKEDEDPEFIYRRNWELDETYPDPVIVYDEWTDENNVKYRDKYEYVPWSSSRTVYDNWDRALYRFERQNHLISQTWKATWWTYANSTGWGSGSGVGWWEEDLGEGAPYAFYGAQRSTLVTQEEPDKCAKPTEEKPDDYSQVLIEEQWESGPLADIVQACGFAEKWFRNIKALPVTRTTISRQFTYYEKDPATGITKTRIDKYIPYVQTPEGAYSIGKRAEDVGQYDNLANQYDDSVLRIIDDAKTIVKYGGETKIRTEREFGLQRRPSQTERIKQTYSRQTPIEQKSELIYAIGSGMGSSAVEFQMPYASDDVIYGSYKTGYGSFSSDAPFKAERYGRLQNRLLLGSNKGVSIQIQAEDMPSYPFSPIHIDLNGFVGQYMTNAQSWAFDSQGIIASCDALFWGGVGSK